MRVTKNAGASQSENGFGSWHFFNRPGRAMSIRAVQVDDAFCIAKPARRAHPLLS
jgi:hypothetical protein